VDQIIWRVVYEYLTDEYTSDWKKHKKMLRHFFDRVRANLLLITCYLLHLLPSKCKIGFNAVDRLDKPTEIGLDDGLTLKD